jgi:predicted MFS family arabinose efflux permease
MSAPAAVGGSVGGLLGARAGVLVFLVFALGYFSSAVVRAVTATLSPVLTSEFELQAGELGLLAGGFFLGFASTQLPLGSWLDRYGPKRVVLGFMAVAVVGCLAFSTATSFAGLLTARVLMGMGLSACLMAPLTGFRRWYEPSQMLRANSWMLMVGSLGMVASTLPVQWLLPLTGWRPLFGIMAGVIVVSMALMARWVPAWPEAKSAGAAKSAGYGPIVRSRAFWRIVPLGLFNYGGTVGMQTLWAGPWLTRVTGLSPAEAAQGLFFLNLSMLAAFWTWGWLTPSLFQRGWSVDRMMVWGVPLSLAMLAANVIGGAHTGWLGWAAFCVLSSVMALAQPALGMKFDASLAGRALSAYNLVVFLGIFLMQWVVGLLIDVGRAWGWSEVASFQGAFTVYLACCLTGYGCFALVKEDNPKP